MSVWQSLSLSPDAHDPEEHLEVKDDDHPDQVCDDLPLGEGRRVEASQHNPRKLGARQTSACQVSTLSSITIIVIFLIIIGIRNACYTVDIFIGTLFVTSHI